MKIAIVHDLLVKLGGAEKVVEKLLSIYPEADLFTLIYDEKKVGKVFERTKIKKIPAITQNIYDLFKNQRFCLPFMSRAVESLDLSEYDVVIASNSAFIHGCITKPETKFIVYYHTPARYMWDRTNEYKREIGWNKGIRLFTLNWMLKGLRMWDFQASQRHDITLANSTNVAKRLKKYYKLDAKVIYPNVEVDRFNKEIELDTVVIEEENENIPKNYYIIISALTEFKRVDVSIKAFNKMPDKNLVIVGAGNFAESLKKIAEKNIIFVGPKYGDRLVNLLQNAKGLIFSGEEDFGIVPIEANGAGKPVFAYRGGGLTETMIEGSTAEFFDNKDGEDFVEKFERFDKNIDNGKYNRETIINNAKKFSEDIFEEKIREVVGF
ncbi:MAG: glycosyltransferase [Candidatus Gracilibacteria bacterium]|nr:glycosyltransferase [Candidatus Gracilibacteria bacterium]